jgi:hypothetical protein
MPSNDGHCHFGFCLFWQVSLVQPVSSIGLVSLALFSRFYLHEVLHATEWVAIGVAVCGIIGLGATTEGLPPDPAAAVHLWRMVVIVTACIILIGASHSLALRSLVAQPCIR